MLPTSCRGKDNRALTLKISSRLFTFRAGCNIFQLCFQPIRWASETKETGPSFELPFHASAASESESHSDSRLKPFPLCQTFYVFPAFKSTLCKKGRHCSEDCFHIPSGKTSQTFLFTVCVEYRAASNESAQCKLSSNNTKYWLVSYINTKICCF